MVDSRTVPGLLTRSAPRRDALLLTALAFLLALVQRPGRATSETKIDLHVDPVGFLADAASLWSPTAELGHVYGGQYGGYLFPMGPFFALGDVAGVPGGSSSACGSGRCSRVAAWGVVRLVDAMVDDARHAGASPPGCSRAQPVRRRLREPHVDHAARLRGVAVAAARGPPGRALAARVVVAGAVRAHRWLHPAAGSTWP